MKRTLPPHPGQYSLSIHESAFPVRSFFGSTKNSRIAPAAIINEILKTPSLEIIYPCVAAPKLIPSTSQNSTQSIIQPSPTKNQSLSFSSFLPCYFSSFMIACGSLDYLRCKNNTCNSKWHPHPQV